MAGQVKYYFPSSFSYIPEYKIESLDKNGSFISVQQDWTNTGVSYSATGFFNKPISLTTGWYRIIIRYASRYTDEVKVGVGEVIFAAGQSNAQGVELQGFGGIPNLGVNYDCISAINENGWCLRNYKFPIFQRMTYSANDKASLIAPHGNQTLWCYQALGKRIVDKNASIVTPVLVFNAASVATSVENWSISAGNENAITYPPLFPLNDDGTPTQCCQTNRFDWGPDAKPEGQPYRGLKTALNYYGGMVGTRGVIWHQGEADNLKVTSQSDYSSRLSTVITQTRTDFNSDLGWAISRVSRYKDNGVISTRNQVKSAQVDVKNNISNSRWGAYYSDEITDRVDDVHFNSSGLSKLAELYDTGNFTGNTAGSNQGGDILSLTPVASNLAPSVTVTRSGTNVLITLNSTYSSYRWVKNEAKINTSTQMGQSITVANTGSDRWRCYALDNKGNDVISQEVALPVEQVIVLGTDPCYGGTYTGISDVISCNEISGWAFKASTNTNSGVGTVDIFVDGIKTGRIYAQNLKPYYFIPPIVIQSYEGYFTTFAENESWKDGQNHTISVRLCETGINFASATLNCPAPTTTPTCDNGSSSPFSITSASYDPTSKCVNYQFNANNLSNANWSISSTTYGSALPQPITRNFGTVNCGITLPDGTYNFVLNGVSCSGSASKSFVVSTGGGNSLSLNQSSWSPSSVFSTLSVNVSSNIAWSVSSSDGSWLTASPGSGNNDGSFTISATANGSTASRSGTITVSGSGVSSQIISVSQAGTGGGASTCSTISTTNCGNASEGYAHSINIPTAGDYKFKITYASGESNPTGSIIVDSDATIQFSVGPSTGSWTPSSDVFVGTVQKTLSAGNHNIRIAGVNGVSGSNFAHNKLCAVSATGGGNTLSLSQGSWLPSSSSASQSINVNSNISWSVSSSDNSWLTISPSSGSGNGSFIINATANSSTSSRSGTITVSGSGVSSQTVTVTQGGSGGGSFPTYSNPQWFHWDNASGSLWFAHYGPTGLLYAATDANPGTPALTRQQLINSGVTPTLANCFLDGRKSRIASGLDVIDGSVEVFPNPTNGKIKISFTLQKDENVWFNLYDTQGKNLQLNDFEGKKGKNEVEFDLQNYSSGAYFIDLQYNQKREVRKVMKVN